MRTSKEGDERVSGEEGIRNARRDSALDRSEFPEQMRARMRQGGRGSMNIPRRGFFLLFAGALLRADDPAKRDMLVRSARPEDLEMPPSGFSE